MAMRLEQSVVAVLWLGCDQELLEVILNRYLFELRLACVMSR